MTDGIKIITVKQNILANNDRAADELRSRLKSERTFLLNLMSSPGSGKTTTLKSTIARLKDKLRIGVMEADIDSDVDALAIAVGNAHGAYKFPPKLDFDRIDALAAVVPVPLVLHGGSGIGDDDFRTAIRKGIAKVNIFTDLSVAGGRAAAAAYSEGKGLADMVLPTVDAVKHAAAAKIRLFGTAGRA